MPAELPLEFAGERLLMLSERALWWPARQALLVADVHLGKGASFRSRGMAVPAGSSAEDLGRLSALAERLGCASLLVLGDLVHARPGRALLDQVARWRNRHPDLALTLVSGNHDRHIIHPPPDWRITRVDALTLSGIRLSHEPSNRIGPEIAGHLHPAYRLRDGRYDTLRAPVFWLRGERLVLPAFGSFTGGFPVRLEPGDRAYAAGPGAVIEITAS